MKMQHLPILVNTDIMCRLGPILHTRCPSAAPNEGALPRTVEANDSNNMQIGEANGSNTRAAMDIPSLAALQSSCSPSLNEERPEQQQPIPVEKCTQENVYNALRDAEPSPPLQQRLDFGQLLDVSARNEAKRDSASANASVGARAMRFVDLARFCFRELHRRSHFSVGLFEVVAVLHARLTALAAVLHHEGVADGRAVAGQSPGYPRGLEATRGSAPAPMNLAGARGQPDEGNPPGSTRSSPSIPLDSAGGRGQNGRGNPPSSTGDPSASVEGRGGDAAKLLTNALAYSTFSARVLAAAVGSNTGEVPKLPSFCGQLCQPRRGDEGIRAEASTLVYAEVRCILKCKCFIA